MTPRHNTLRYRLPFLVAALAASCGAQARAQKATSAVTPQSGADVQFRDPADLLHKSAPRIRTVVDSTVRLVAGTIGVTGVTIAIAPNARGAIPGYGVGGYTPSAALVLISVDPVYADSATMFDQHLAQTVAHELHHARRDRGPGYGESLLESMVSEGLADHFAVELLRMPAPPWTHALTAEQVDKYLAVAAPEFDRPKHDHARWFFGSADLPNWTGYTIGYELISRYLNKHPHETAALLVDTAATAFRP